MPINVHVHDPHATAGVPINDLVFLTLGLSSHGRAKCLGEDLVFEMMNCMGVPNSFDKQSLVQSYNQLYTQALLIHSPLRKKIQGWALQSGGYLPLIEGEGTEGARFSNHESSILNPDPPRAIESNQVLTGSRLETVNHDPRISQTQDPTSRFAKWADAEKKPKP